MDQQDYKKLYQKMLPKGPVWGQEKSNVSATLAEAISSFLYFLHGRIEKASSEMFAQSCNETLVDWENMLGLPEPCEHGNHAEGMSIVERKLEVISKIRRKFSPTIANYQELVEFLGYTGVTFIETSANHLKVQIRDTSRTIWARAGSARCGDYMCQISYIDELECTLKRFIQAHIVLTFDYGE